MGKREPESIGPDYRGTGRPPFHWERFDAEDGGGTYPPGQLVGIFDADDKLLMPIIGHRTEGYFKWAEALADRLCLAFNCTLPLNKRSLVAFADDVLRVATKRVKKDVGEGFDVEIEPFSMEMSFPIEAGEATVVGYPKSPSGPKESAYSYKDLDYSKTLSNGRLIRESIQMAKDRGDVPFGKCFGCLEMIPLPPMEGIKDGDDVEQPREGDMLMCPLCGHISELRDGTIVELEMNRLSRFAERNPRKYESMIRNQKIIRMRRD